MGDPIKGVFNAFVDLHGFSSPSRKYSELYQYIKPHSPERMALSWLEYGMRMGSYFDRAIGDLGLPKPTTYEVQYKSQLTI
ncbi:hypothetical protein SPBRAN_565 [uncultured Candidatus Thioglobus sp.]|nr:hypothetical protein SPBRAN_565 [uncultured Candidatus Thioglobus sp.]